MSRRRVSNAPGEASWQTEDPRVARIHLQRGSIGSGMLIAGAFVVGQSTRDRELEMQRAAMRKARAK